MGQAGTLAGGRVVVVVLAGLALLGAGGSARATDPVMVDQAVTLHFPPTHWGPAPAADLTGTEPSPTTDIVYNSGWWYRVDGDTREYPLPPPDSQGWTGADYWAEWPNLDGKAFWLRLDEHVFDHEGPSGGFWSRVSAQNHGPTRRLTLFHYLDVDAAGSSVNDYAQRLSTSYVEQSEGGGASVVRYRALTAAWCCEGTSVAQAVMLYPSLRDLLNDEAVTDFFPSSGSVGPGDVTAAYEFSRLLVTGNSESLMASVAVYSNMPSRYVKGAVSDATPFPVLLYNDTSSDVAQMMRRAAMLTGELDWLAWWNGRPVGVDDFDADYSNEVLYRDLVTGALSVDDTPLSGATTPPLNWVVTATGDFNGDGRADILWRNTTSQRLVVWFMNGAVRIGAQAPNPDHAVDANWDAAGTGDFDGDSFRDILWYNQTSGKLVIWYMDGNLQRITGGFTEPSTVGNNNWKVVAVGDYGKGAGGGTYPPVWNATDIVWQNDTSYKIVIWYMDKQGRRTSGTFTTPDAFGTWQVVLGPR